MLYHNQEAPNDLVDQARTHAEKGARDTAREAGEAYGAWRTTVAWESIGLLQRRVNYKGRTDNYIRLEEGASKGPKSFMEDKWGHYASKWLEGGSKEYEMLKGFAKVRALAK